MSVSGPVGVPTQPNYFPEKENLVERNQNTSLSKIILEGNTKSMPSSLQTKKVSPVASEPILEQEETGYTPLKFRVSSKQTKGIQSVIDNAATIISEIANERRLNKDPKHRLNDWFCWAAARIMALLAKSKLAHMKGLNEIEKDCIECAKRELNGDLQHGYFHGDMQYASYFYKASTKIEEANLVNMDFLRELLLSLRRAIILQPDNAIPSRVSPSEELKSICDFLTEFWGKLKNEGQLDEETYNRLNQNLEQILAEDPFKDEFIKNPELFKQVKNAPEGLLKKYPHLASASDFLSRYPTAGWIELPNQTFNTENLKLCINKAKTSPLARTLVLESADAIITPSHAYLIKNLIVEKQNLTILLGNEDDLITLTTAFHEDKTIAFDEKTFLAGRTQINKSESEFILFGINSQSPIRKIK